MRPRLFTGIIIVGCSLISMPVSAQVRRCEIRSLRADDEQRLMTVAVAAFPPSSTPRIVFRCRNPEFASADLATRAVDTAEGVRQQWKTTCNREAVAWTCGAPELTHYFRLPVTVGGKRRRVSLTFDRLTSLARAKTVAAPALNVVADPEAQVGSCDREPKGATQWPGQRDALTSHQEWSSKIAVRTQGGTTDVTFGDRGELVLEFSLSEMPSEPPSPCWAEQIVVT